MNQQELALVVLTLPEAYVTPTLEHLAIERLTEGLRAQEPVEVEEGAPPPVTFSHFHDACMMLAEHLESNSNIPPMEVVLDGISLSLPRVLRTVSQALQDNHLSLQLYE